MAKDTIQGPASAAGLMRYLDVSGGGIEITPESVVIGVSVFVGLILVMLYLI